MTSFTDAELDYLQCGERRLARLATIGADGTPHLSPVGYSHNHALDTIDIGGMNLEQTKKFRDVQHNDRVAVVIDDVPALAASRRGGAGPGRSSHRR